MNIIELEEGLRNLIATQPSILSGQHASIIGGIKNIIEAHKAFSFRVNEYPVQDILKVGIMNESSKLELNLVSYVCQVLQERGINIMLYVPKYAAVYNQEISKYVDNVLPEENKEIVPVVEQFDEAEIKSSPEKPEEKYMVVEKSELANKKPEKKENQKKPIQPEKKEQVISSKSQGRDYLMELLKK